MLECLFYYLKLKSNCFLLYWTLVSILFDYIMMHIYIFNACAIIEILLNHVEEIVNYNFVAVRTNFSKMYVCFASYDELLMKSLIVDEKMLVSAFNSLFVLNKTNFFDSSTKKKNYRILLRVQSVFILYNESIEEIFSNSIKRSNSIIISRRR